jgi:hypothetical protein
MKAIRLWYERNFMCVEFLLALVMGLAFFAATRFHTVQNKIEAVLSGSHQTLYATIASIGGSLLGFILTAVSVVVVFGQLPKLKTLRASPHYASVFHIFSRR